MARSPGQQIPGRRSFAPATPRNIRDPTEIVFRIGGLRSGVPDQSLFSLRVVMAIVTTVMAEALDAASSPGRRGSGAEPAGLGAVPAYRALVLVDEPRTQWHAVALAGAVVGTRRPAEVVLSRLLPYRIPALEVGTGLSAELLEMTESMTELERLAGRVRRTDVRAPVLSRFTDDVERDVLAQIEATAPAVVVVHAGRPGLAGIRAAATGRLLIVGPAPAPATPPSAVAVRCGGDRDSWAALQVGVAVAVARTVPLVIGTPGRPERWALAAAAELTELGVPTVVGAAPADALVVAADSGGDQPPAGAGVGVRAEPDADPRPLSEWTAELRVPLADQPAEVAAAPV